MPAGIAIAAILGGGHAAIYALLLAGGSAAILLPVIEELGLLGDERILVVMAQVAVADVSAIVALPLVMQPSKADRAALGGLAVAAAALAIFGLAYLLRHHPYMSHGERARPSRRPRNRSQRVVSDAGLPLP